MTTSSLIQPARVWLRRASLDRRLTSAVLFQRHEILGERGALLELAADLESDDRLQPRGIAFVERLLTSPDSPVYLSSPEGTLREALGQARAALYLA